MNNLAEYARDSAPARNVNRPSAGFAIYEDGLVLGLRGEYLHFRCEQHKVDGYHHSGQANYRCGIRGCERPASAYWYKGEQYQRLPTPEPVTFTLGEWTP